MTDNAPMGKRIAATVIDYEVMYLLFGFVAFITARSKLQRQRLGDMLAKTRVVGR